MTAYKLVRNIDGRFFSAVQQSSFRLEYGINCVTIPVVGKLFMFKYLPTRRQISAIVNPKYEKVSLLLCYVPSLTKLEDEITLEQIDFENWWKGKPLKYSYREEPIEGTYFADWCVPVKEVALPV